MLEKNIEDIDGITSKYVRVQLAERASFLNRAKILRFYNEVLERALTFDDKYYVGLAAKYFFSLSAASDCKEEQKDEQSFGDLDLNGGLNALSEEERLSLASIIEKMKGRK